MIKKFLKSKFLRNLTAGNLNSQAALEFLTTYAWAFLVILIMIAALAYFGILTPNKILPNRCTFGSEIGCQDFAVDYGTGGLTGTFVLKLKNAVGEPIVVTAVDLSSESATSFTCGALDTPALPYTWTTGGITDFSWSGCNAEAAGFREGGKAKILVTLSYYLAKSSATYTRQVDGEVFTTVT